MIYLLVSVSSEKLNEFWLQRAFYCSEASSFSLASFSPISFSRAPPRMYSTSFLKSGNFLIGKPMQKISKNNLLRCFPRKKKLTHSSHFDYGQNFVIDIFVEPGFELLKGIFEGQFRVVLNMNLILGGLQKLTSSSCLF